MTTTASPAPPAPPAAPAELTVAGVGGKPVSMRTLQHIQTQEAVVTIAASPDRMRAYMSLVPGPKYAGMTRDKLVKLAAFAGIKYGLSDAGVDLYLALLNAQQPYTDYFQIASGDPMCRGENGSVEFHVQPTRSAPVYDVTEQGTIDYRQANLIENCFTGQRIAAILPPGPGRAGKDIFGTVLPAVPGTPIHIVAGAGVTLEENGRTFAARSEGRVIYEHDSISVSPTLEINHDIDFSVGNVDFVGKVIVRGSLLDGFYINARKGVEITGEVGAASITSDGDVHITGGIRGKNTAFISCRRLVAHYIDDTSVEATGDVLAAKEILNSSVKSLGRVMIPGGAIVGGSVCGFHGVEAETIGSEMGVSTTVMSGLNWTDEDCLEELRDRIADHQERILTAQTILTPLLAAKESLGRLESEQKTTLSELIGELRELRDVLTEALDQRQSILDRRQTRVVCQINVLKTLCLGVKVRFPETEQEIRNTVKGPLSLVPAGRGKPVRLGPRVMLPEPPSANEPPEPKAAAGTEDFARKTFDLPPLDDLHGGGRTR